MSASFASVSFDLDYCHDVIYTQFFISIIYNARLYYNKTILYTWIQ